MKTNSYSDLVRGETEAKATSDHSKHAGNKDDDDEKEKEEERSRVERQRVLMDLVRRRRAGKMPSYDRTSSLNVFFFRYIYQ